MALKKTDSETNTNIDDALINAAPSTSDEVVPPPDLPPVFRDKAFKTRTLILDDGRAFIVEKSRIEAADPALHQYLEQHPDFIREG